MKSEKLSCTKCGKEFLRYSSHKKSNNSFCSKECYDIYRTGIPNVKLRKDNAIFTKVMNGYKMRSREYGFEFELTLEQFKTLILSDCHYCGQPPSRPATHRINNEFVLVNGIDRKDNNLGYNLKNSLPCCKRCNYAKRNYSYEDFMDWIVRVYKRI